MPIRLKVRLAADAVPGEAGRLWTAAYVLMGLRYPAELIAANKARGWPTHRQKAEFTPNRLYLWILQLMGYYQKDTGKDLGPTDIDVVVPVPLHRQRERERGYNQADLIARPLAKRLRLAYREVLLVRTRPRPAKQILSLEERWTSVRGAFATRPGSQVDNLRVLLVDDVLTTGATLDACARALREAGTKSVIGLTVARALRNPLPGAREW